MVVSKHVNREKTAIQSNNPSVATKYAYEKGFIEEPIYDWGSGKGRDTVWLRKKGFRVIEYDPFFSPEKHPDTIDFSKVNTILLNFVLNVIENKEERTKIIDTIKDKTKKGTKVIISVRRDKVIEKEAKKKGWKKYGDGYLTSKNTFQKGFSAEELGQICESIGAVKVLKKGKSPFCIVEKT